MTTKLPKLPAPRLLIDYNDYCVEHYLAGDMEAYANEAVADALRPAGDNAEHVRVLEALLHSWVRLDDSPTRAALTAAIAALSQPSVAVTEAQDAARYRLIRSCHDNKHKPVAVVVWGDEPWEPESGDKLDAAVDAALTQGAANEAD